MREVRDANVIGLERIAIMTALNMSHELLRARQSVSQDSESEARVQALLGRLLRYLRSRFEYQPPGVCPSSSGTDDHHGAQQYCHSARRPGAHP